MVAARLDADREAVFSLDTRKPALDPAARQSRFEVLVQKHNLPAARGERRKHGGPHKQDRGCKHDGGSQRARTPLPHELASEARRLATSLISYPHPTMPPVHDTKHCALISRRAIDHRVPVSAARVQNMLGRTLKILLLTSLVVGLFASQFFVDLSRYLPLARLEEWLDRAGALAPLLLISMMAAAVVVSPIPSLPFDLVAGKVFGPIWGTLYAATGALIGAAVSFQIARWLGRGLIERFIGGHINFCSRCSDKLVAKIVFFSRLVPVVSFDVVSYGAGLTKVSLRVFCLATFFGMLPLTFLYTYFGSAEIHDPRLTIAVGVGMVVSFFIVPRWIERRDPLSLKRYFEHDEDSADSA
ncbi:MAG: TVP38/TMEM64 family protein [Candidatus Dadabacteria bacterium]|nr:MAG: TVP38/TMEM64 family protein [Candidatus Dadabacteria bacterium]